MGVGPNYGLSKGFLATGSTAYAVGECVMVNTAEQSCQRATSAKKVGMVGVVQEDLDTTKLATGKAVVGVALTGIVRALAGAAVAKDALLSNDATARLITATTAGDPVVGIALTACSNPGEFIDVMLTPGATK